MLVAIIIDLSLERHVCMWECDHLSCLDTVRESQPPTVVEWEKLFAFGLSVPYFRGSSFERNSKPPYPTINKYSLDNQTIGRNIFERTLHSTSALKKQCTIQGHLDYLCVDSRPLLLIWIRQTFILSFGNIIVHFGLLLLIKLFMPERFVREKMIEWSSLKASSLSS